MKWVFAYSKNRETEREKDKTWLEKKSSYEWDVWGPHVATVSNRKNEIENHAHHAYLAVIS